MCLCTWVSLEFLFDDVLACVADSVSQLRTFLLVQIPQLVPKSSLCVIDDFRHVETFLEFVVLCSDVIKLLL